MATNPFEQVCRELNSKKKMSGLTSEYLETSSERGGKTLNDEYLGHIKKPKRHNSGGLSYEYRDIACKGVPRHLHEEYFDATYNKGIDARNDEIVPDDDFWVRETTPVYSQPTGADGSIVHNLDKPLEKDADCAYAIAKDILKRERIIVVRKSVHRYNGIVYERLLPDEVVDLVFKTYHRQLDVPNKLSVVRNAASYLSFLAETLDDFPLETSIMVFRNGTFEVETKRFRNNSPDDMANFALAIDYDPEQFLMPEIEKFLRRICGRDSELYERFLQFYGYCISNDKRAKAFPYLQGPSHTGKSKALDLLTQFFPEDSIDVLAIQDFGSKFALGSMANKRIVIADDLSDTVISPAAISKIKQITGSERIGGEEKYVPRFQFKPQVKVVFASNASIKLKEYDQAFVNRVELFPFRYAIPKEHWDTDILNKMKPELPALFNHAFAAYRRLVANNYVWTGTGRFEPEIIIEKPDISFEKKHGIRWFLRDCCEFDRDCEISVEDLQLAYTAYCSDCNYSSVVGDRFSREFLGVVETEFPGNVERIKIGNQKRGYRGVTIKRYCAN